MSSLAAPHATPAPSTSDTSNEVKHQFWKRTGDAAREMGITEVQMVCGAWGPLVLRGIGRRNCEACALIGARMSKAKRHD